MNETPTRLAAPSPGPTSQSAPSPATEALGVPSFETMDRLGRAVTARLTQGISPHALYAAWFDWASHLANAPGRLIELGLEAVNIGARFARFATHSLSEDVKRPFEPQSRRSPLQRRFWKRLPYALWQQAFLAQEAWWASATREVRGMTPKNAARDLLHHPPIARRVVAVECALAQSGGHRSGRLRSPAPISCAARIISRRISGARSPCSLSHH